MRVSLNNLISKCAFVSVGVLATFGVAVAQLGGGSDLVNKGPKTIEFVENRGQWDSRAMFLSTQPGLDYWVTQKGIKVDMYRLEPTGPPGEFGQTGGTDRPELKRTGHVVSFEFVGAGDVSEPWGYKPSDVGIDFYVGPTSKHARNVHAYGEAYIKSLFPGIHLRNYMEDSKPRYDVVVEPGADPSQVVFEVKGADRVYIDAKGNLVVETDMGLLEHSGLFAYQPVGNMIKPVDAEFVMLNSTTVAIRLGAYDAQLPVIIDPLVYGTYVGSDSIPFVSSGYEQVFGIQADDEGNLFVTGETTSISFPITDGPYGFVLGAGTAMGFDAFIIRLEGDSYDTSYVAYLGGSGDDTGYSIGFHRDSGDLWVMGSTESADFPGAINSLTGTEDVFLSKFTVDTTGAITPVSSWYYDPGDGADSLDMVVSTAGKVFFTGRNTGLSLTPYLPGAAGGGGDLDGFVVAMDSTGTVLWERQYGSVNDDVIGQMDVDPQGNVLVTGSFFQAGIEDTATAGTPSFHTTAGVYPEGRLIRNGDIFVIKLDGAGSTVFSTLVGGSLGETSYAVASDFENNIYVAGATGSFDYPRNPGAYEENPEGSLTATKIAADGTALLYSTGLRTQGPIWLNAIDIDGRGILTLGGVVSWAINPASGPNPGGPALPTLPGSITVVNPLDGEYIDGDEPHFIDGSFPGCSSTSDGFVIFLNSSGTDVLFADYIGQESDEMVNDIFVDSVGATWIAGFTLAAVCIPPAVKNLPPGIVPWLTPNAFKANWGGSGDGFLIKMRVDLPIVNNIVLTPEDVAGGLGVISTATISLRDPAPTGGVTVTVTLSNANATSFSAAPGMTSTTVVIAEATTSSTVDIFTLPVSAQTTSDVRAILDNDFVEERLTIKPWLDDFSVSPATLVGGNQLTIRVTLFQDAIVQTAVSLSTDRPDLVTLPSPADVIVPIGAKTVSILLETAGVVTSQDFNMTGALLGVAKSAPATLTPAAMQTLSFNPSSVNGGSDSTGTVTLNGKAGADRTVAISYVNGQAGLLINGNAMPENVVVLAQESSVEFVATTPFVASATFTTVRGDDGTTTADGTIFIDDIDIDELLITPETDVVSGTILTGQVKLTRAAGSGGFTVDLGNSNTAAGTLSVSTVDVPEGSLLSPTFTFDAAVVSADEITTLSASKAGFTTSNVVVTVRAIDLTLTLLPPTVVGGVDDSVGTITLSAPAPVNGLTVDLTSSNDTIASVPPDATVPGGATTVDFTVTSSVTQSDVLVNISAIASPAVGDSTNLLVLTPGIISLVIDPSSVTGPGVVTGTVTLAVAAPAGGLDVGLSASPSSIVSMPSTVTVDEGDTSGSFTITAIAVSFNTDVTVTATLGSSVDSAILIVRSPAVTGITFSPPMVQGGGLSIGTITLDQPAASDILIEITNFNPLLATLGSTTITIFAGSRTGTFSVQTVRVSRLRSVIFSAGPAGSPQFASGMLYIKP